MNIDISFAQYLYFRLFRVHISLSSANMIISHVIQNDRQRGVVHLPRNKWIAARFLLWFHFPSKPTNIALVRQLKTKRRTNIFNSSACAIHFLFLHRTNNCFSYTHKITRIQVLRPIKLLLLVIFYREADTGRDRASWCWPRLTEWQFWI